MKDDLFELKISAYTPETIPMNRLAEYLLRFAAVLGHETHVHFDRLVSGSTNVQVRVEPEDIPKVSQRLNLIDTPEAPQDLQRAVVNLNDYLRADNARASLKQARSAKIIAFPGCDAPAFKKIGPVREVGQLEGSIVRIGGKDRTIHALLVGDDGTEYKLTTTNREIAKDLAKHLFSPVRVTGTGTWFRGAEGRWELEGFALHGFEPISDRTLIEAVTGLRGLEGDGWRDIEDPLAAWQELRRN